MDKVIGAIMKLLKDRITIIEPLVKNKSVLDIGCVDARPDGTKKYASKGLHNFLKEKAKELTGVDIDEEGVKAMNSEGYNIIAANGETMNLGEKYDCIVAGEIIEHLSNAGLFIEKVYEHLKDDGVFIVTTSNAFAISSFTRIFAKNKIKVHSEHTCWYDPKTLSELLRRYSFEVEDVYFSNKPRWYLKKNFYKLKYQFLKFIVRFRPYFSGSVIIVAKKKK